MQKFVLERAVEATSRGRTTVFKDTALQTLGSQLNIHTKPKAESAPAGSVETPKPAAEAAENEEGKKPKKNKKTAAKKPKNIVESSSASDDDVGDDDVEEEPAKKRKRK